MCVCVCWLEFHSGNGGFWLAYNFKRVFSLSSTLFLSFFLVCGCPVVRSIFIARQANFSCHFLFAHLYISETEPAYVLRLPVFSSIARSLAHTEHATLFWFFLLVSKRLL